jgi:hypothetical protein
LFYKRRKGCRGGLKKNTMAEKLFMKAFAKEVVALMDENAHQKKRADVLNKLLRSLDKKRLGKDDISFVCESCGDYCTLHGIGWHEFNCVSCRISIPPYVWCGQEYCIDKSGAMTDQDGNMVCKECERHYDEYMLIPYVAK